MENMEFEGMTQQMGRKSGFVRVLMDEVRLYPSMGMACFMWSMESQVIYMRSIPQVRKMSANLISNGRHAEMVGVISPRRL